MKRTNCAKRFGKEKAWIQASLTPAFIVISCAFWFLSCSTENMNGPTKVVLTLPVSGTATAILSTATKPAIPPLPVTATDALAPTLPQNTPVATATSSFTPTPEPTHTPVSTPTVVPQPTTTWVVAALVYPAVHKVMLVSPMGELVQEISAPGTPIDVAWSPGGCHLQVMVTTGESIRLFDIDLANQIQRELFAGGRNVAGYWTTSPTLSPDGRWIAYVVWSGKGEYIGAEFQDVEVVAVGEQTKPFRLTRQGGAGVYGGAWSPDSQYLAYSDYDEAGNGQLYYSRPDGSDRRQLTRFTMSKVTMDVIRWSPDSQRLAFSAYNQENTSQGVWVVRSDGSDLHEATLSNGGTVEGAPLWWSADSRTLIVSARGDVSAEGLYWFDTDTGKAYHVFHNSASPDPKAGIVFPFPIFDIQMIGFSAGAYEIYSYSLTDSLVKPWLDTTSLFPELDFDSEGGVLLQQIRPVPGGVVDISQCPSK